MKNLYCFFFVLFSLAFAHAEAGSLTGKVTNLATNEALSNATIQVQSLEITVATTTTNSSGNYTISNLGLGAYTVVASLTGYQPATNTNVIIPLIGTTTSNFQLAALGSISGTITNSSGGVAISGATVQMIQSGSVIGSATTSATGAYSIPGLAPGSYTLSVSANHFQTNTAAVTISSNTNTSRDLTLLPNPGTVSGAISSSNTLLGIAGATITFSAEGSTVATATSGLLGLYSVSSLPPRNYTVSVNYAGYQTATSAVSVTSDATTTLNVNLVLLNGSLIGKISDGVTGSLLSGATVLIKQGSSVIATTTTDSQGNYSFSNLSPGNYTVSSSLTNYQTTNASATIGSNQATTLNSLLQPLPGIVAGVISNSQTSLSLANATVTVYSGTTIVASTTTNSAGNFSISGLAVGTYTLTASLNNFVALSQTITIASNATLTANLALTPQLGIVTGIVQDLSSLSLLGGATVNLLQGNTVVATTTTTLAGLYLFNVLPGSYTIQVAKANYVSATLSATVLSNVTVAVNVTLIANPGTATGQIIDATTSALLANATVQILQGSTVVASTTTNSSGKYSVSGLASGTYTLSVGLTNYVTETAPLIVVSNQTTTANLGLQPQRGTANGQIKNALNSSAVQGATVGFYQGAVLVATATTDASGNYSVASLVPGSYTLRVTATNFQNTQQAIVIQSNATTTTNVNLQFLPGSLSGVVTHAQTSALLAGVTVTISQGSTVVATTTTNSLGVYSFAGVVPGNYNVVASGTNFTSSTQATTVNANATTTTNFSLQPQLGTVTGQISSTLTAGFLANVTVNALQGTTIVASANTDVNGNYTLTLPSGNYTISYLLSNFQMSSQSVTVQPNATVALNISLTPVNGTISGLVTSAATLLPLNGATVVILQGTTTMASVQTNALGNYTVSNLSPGNYTVQFSLNNYQTVTQPQTVSSSATTTANAALQLQPGNVSGVITNGLTSSPFSGVTVTAFLGATQVSSAVTNSTGSYNLASLAPGTYTITSTAANFQTASQMLVVVTANNTTTVNLTLQPMTGTVSGTITNAATTNPIVGASINVLKNGVSFATALSVINGSYSISNLPPGDYTLVVSALNYQGISQPLTISSNTTTTASVALQSSPGAIGGFVTNSLTLLPIAGATVQVLNGANVLATATTAIDGSYTISGLAPAPSGTYSFRASAPNFQTSTTTAAVIANVTTPVSFTLVSQPGTLTGSITNSQTEVGISGANIQIMQGVAFSGSATSDSNGNYTISGLAPGPYTVVVNATNFQTASQGVLITANQTATLNIPLQPSLGTLSGIIRDNLTSTPIVGAVISVKQGNSIIDTVVADSSGNYVISGLAPGTYAVLTSMNNFQTTLSSVVIVPNSTSQLGFTLSAQPGSNNGQVTDALTLLPVASATIDLLQNGIVIASILTDADGNYTLGGLAPGQYTLRVTATNYQTISEGLAISANQIVSSQISLLAFPGSVGGVVTDFQTAQPIANATVRIFQGAVLIITGSTDADGNYLLTGLAAGNYTINVVAANHQNSTQGALVQDNTVTLVDVALLPNPATVNGTITDAVTLLPIPNVSVQILSGSTLIGSALTDANGNYVVTGLNPGSYTLALMASNYQSSTTTFSVLANQILTENVTLNINPGTLSGAVVDGITLMPITGANISILHGSSLVASQITDSNGNWQVANLAPGSYTVVVSASSYQSGTLGATVQANFTSAVNTSLTAQPGGVIGQVTSGSSALAGAIVDILQENTVVATAVTDSQGNYSINSLAPGSYSIRGSSANYTTVIQGLVVVADTQATVNLSLSPNPGKIVGQLIDVSTSQPVAGVVINLSKGSSLIASTTTDSNGNYLIINLSAGNYTITTSSSLYQTISQGVALTASQLLTLNLSLNGQPGSITGQVSDQSTGLSLAGAAITVLNGSNVVANAVADTNGNYSVTGLAPGSYEIRATLNAYQTGLQSVIVTASASSAINFTLVSNPGSVTGQIKDLGGDPITGSSVVLHVLQGNTILASTLTDSTGVYLINNLPAGTYSLSVMASGYQNAVSTVTIEAGLTTSLDFNLATQPGNLKGTISGASGVIAGATIQVSLNFSIVTSVLSDSAGNYQVSNLAPGQYSILVTAPDYQSFTKTVAITANATTTSNVSLLHNPGSIGGSVVDAVSGLPVAGIVIRVSNNSTVVASALTDVNGNFLISGLAPGSYSVSAIGMYYQTGNQSVNVTGGITTSLNFGLISQPGSIAGVVSDSNSNPIPNALIELIQGVTVLASAQADNNGNYMISGLAAGNYIIRTTTNLYQISIQGASVAAGAQTTANFTLQSQPGNVTGVIQDANSHTPISAATVSVFQNGTLIASSQSQSNGHYTIGNLPVGNYIITSNAANYQMSLQGITVAANSSLTTNFNLVQGQGITQGQVLDASTSQPIINATVSIYNGSAFVTNTQTDSNGNYFFNNLAPGQYRLAATATAFETATQGVLVTSSATSTANFSLTSQSGSISGVISSVSAQPIVGAQISITVNQQVVATTLTDSNGNYTVNGLTPGSYTVAVNAQNFQASSQGAIVALGATTNVTFALSSDTGSINVEVKDSLGYAIAGATVDIILNQTVVASFLVDANGNVLFDQLAPGHYSVRVKANGYQTYVQAFSVAVGVSTTLSTSLKANPGSLIGTVVDQNTSTPLENASVQMLQGNVVIASGLTSSTGTFAINGLAPGSYTVRTDLQNYQIYSAGASISSGIATTTLIGLQSNPGNASGTITDGITGLAIPGALIEIKQNTTLIAAQQADSNGNFAIDNLPPGSYVLQISSSNYQSTIVSLTVTANQNTVVNAVLQGQPGTLFGSITNGATHLPIGNATVNIFNSSVLIATALTDVNGNYSLGGLPSGNYQINIQAPGYQIAVKAANLIAGEIEEADFTLSTLIGTVAGTIMDAQSNLPAVGANVAIFQGTTLITSILTDSNGSYTLTNLTPGSYSLVVTASGFQTNVQTVNVQANQTTSVSVNLTNNPATISGQILDTNSVPIAGAIVQVSDGQIIIGTDIADSQGQFVISNLPSGYYVVTISAPNYQTAIQSANLSPGQMIAINITLDSFPATISGSVSNNASQPLAGATVNLLQGSTVVSSTLTGSSGDYLFSGVGDGNYTVQVMTPGYQLATVPVYVNPGSIISGLNLTLQAAPGVVKGSVSNGTSLLANASVNIFNGNNLVASTFTDSFGVYSLNNLPSGSFTIQASLNSYQTAIQGVQVSSDETATVNFVLEPLPSTINGTVLSAIAMLPISGATINLYNNSILTAATLTDANGHYLLTGLSSANYVLNAGATGYEVAANGILLASNSTVTSNFTLASQPGSVIGVMRDPNGNPLTGITVTVSKNNSVVTSVVTGIDGSYSITGLAPGSYTVSTTASSYQGSSQGVMVFAGEASALDFALNPQPGGLFGVILDGQSNPVAGAQVSISQNGNLVANAISGSNGSFNITGLGTGNFTVVVTASQYQTTTAGIILSAGQQLSRSFTLSSNVGSIQGLVTDLASVPLANATITLSQSSISIASTITDANGQYSLTNLAPGSYVVTCSLANYQTTSTGAIVSTAAATSVNFQLTVDIGQVSGSVTDFNLGTPVPFATVNILSQSVIIATATTDSNGAYTIGGLAPGSYIINIQATNYQTASMSVAIQTGLTTQLSLGLQANPGSVNGLVQSNDLPIANAIVSVSVLQGNTVLSSSLTDSNGHYMVSGLQPGTYVIQANASGHQMQIQSITVVANQVVTVNFSLVANPGSVNGTVLDGITLNPVAGALVQILQGSVVVNSTLSDSSGNFIFNNLAAGSYNLTINAPNYEIDSRTIQISNGQTVQVSVNLQSNPGSLTGTVIDISTNQPISGAAINVVKGLTLISSTLTDVNGYYTINQLSPGSYSIQASATNYQTGNQGCIITSGSGAIENFALNIQPSTISGVVTDSDTLQAIPGASITVMQNNQVIGNTLTDVNGSFSLSGMAAGSYLVQSTANGYQSSNKGITLGANVVGTVDFSLQSNPGSIQGTVIDASHQPIVGASVVIDILQGNILVAQSLTDSNGQYFISNLAEGSYVVQISATGYQTVAQGAIVAIGQTTTVDITLQANPGSISGTIADAVTSLGISGVTVNIFNGPVKISSSVTNTNGEYTVTGLAPGSYTVAAAISGYQSGTIMVTVAANTTVMANIALQGNPGTFKGVVTDSNANPLAGVFVNVTFNGVSIATGLTGQDGSYQIIGLPVGTYILTFTAPGFQNATLGASVQAGQIVTENMSLLPNPGLLLGQIIDQNTGLPVPNVNVQLLQNNVIVANILSDAQGNFSIQNLAPGIYTARLSASGFQTIIENVTIVANLPTTITPSLVENPGTLTGLVTNTSLVPLPNINVQLFQNFMMLAETITDSVGDYTVQGLAPGTYSVVTGGQGYAIEDDTAVIVSNSTTNLDFTLDSSQGSISGTILSSISGNRMAGVTVNLFSGATLIAVTQTDANGLYSFISLAPGSYTLRVSAPNHQTLTDTIIVIDGQNTEANEVLEQLPGALSGVVRDVFSGKPLKNVVVVVFGGDFSIANAMTDALGNYSVPSLPPGVYTVEFSLSTYETLETNVTIVSNESTVFDVLLVPFPLAPSSVKQCKLGDKFATQKQYFVHVQWPHTTSLGVIAYRIYRDGIFYAQVSSTQLFFNDPVRSKTEEHVYEVSSVNSFDLESPLQPATVTKGSGCSCGR